MQNIVGHKDVWISLDSMEKAKEQVEALGCIWHDWYYEKAIRPESYEPYFSFWTMDTNPATFQYVSPQEIIGQVHDRYEGQEPRWLGILYDSTDRWKSKDTDKNKADIERQNLGNNPVHLYEINGKYYIAEGIHRAVLAKFLEMETIRCRITHFCFDEKDFGKYKRICQTIGEGILSPKEYKLGCDFVSFRWLGVFFTIGKDDECITCFEELYRQARQIHHNVVSRMLFFIKRHFMPQHFWGSSVIINHDYTREDNLPILVDALGR